MAIQYRAKHGRKRVAFATVMDFSHKVVIVTGASSGIGAAAAKLFASNGARLVLVAKSESKLHTVASECQVYKGLTHLCMALDLTERGSCELVINKTVEAFGKIDVLVNGATKIALSSLSDQCIDIFDELMAINVRVPYRLTQLAHPHLAKSRGSVVNVGSSMTRRWKRGLLPYAMSINALERFSRFAGPELSLDGIRINTVSPGVTRANLLANLKMSKSCSEYIFNTLKDEFPHHQVIEPGEVAVLVCLAACDLFPNMTGSNLTLDGAASMA